MNEVIESLFNRKSVRQYEDRPISDEDKKIIFDAALQAPSAGNMTLYSVIDVTDKKLKETLAVTCDNQPFIATAPLVLVFCADYHRWYGAFKDCAGEDVRKPSYGDFLLAVADALIAAQNCVVAAESLGIGSCYIGDITENYETHKELLGLPKHVAPAAMLCFGYPTESQKVRQKPTRFKAEDIFFENTYDEKKANNMKEMLCEKQNLESDERYYDWLYKFCKRKWDCDFSREMSRSCKAMIDDFCE